MRGVALDSASTIKNDEGYHGREILEAIAFYFVGDIYILVGNS